MVLDARAVTKPHVLDIENFQGQAHTLDPSLHYSAVQCNHSNVPRRHAFAFTDSVDLRDFFPKSYFVDPRRSHDLDPLDK